MSIRIYNLSKKLNMTNQDLLALLQERGFNVKSHSSTIDTVSAENLVEEFTSKRQKNVSVSKDSHTEPFPSTQKSEIKPEPEKVLQSFPKSLVKSKEQVEQDREAKKNKHTQISYPAQLVRNAPASPPRQKVQPASITTAPSAKRTATTAKEEETKTVSPEVSQAESPDGLKPLQVKSPIIVRDFAMHLSLKPFQLISELMDLGIFASMNQTVDENIAQEVAKRKGFQLEIRHRGEQVTKPQKTEKKVEYVREALEPRPSVVCILGHVDHGKTTLLDTIRKTNIVTEESGGITQHIGAYQITHNDQKISFIDTPGHAAFSKMRKRGANVTDIAILVVASDDGFMPQTDEALKHAQSFQVPIIVAINKIDATGANIDRVKQQMQERNIAPEEWGGETITVSISALKAEGIEDLLEMITLQAEIMELKALYKAPAEGIIIESQKEIGHGSTTSAIIQTGVLKVGDTLVSGSSFCKVRSLMDDRGNKVQQAPPSSPIKIVGWSGTPDAGSLFKTVKNERVAKTEAEANALQSKLIAARTVSSNTANSSSETASSALDLLFSNIEKTQKHTFRAVIKADVYGTAEALAASLEAIESSKVNIEIVQIGVGVINQKDVQVATAAKAAIVGFNVNLENGVSSLAKHEGISIYRHDIIYELVDTIKESMSDLLDPEKYEVKLGTAEVREVFSLSKGTVAGCFVTDGRIVRDTLAKLIRSGTILSKGKIDTLKRFKEDANEVRFGYECGISLEGNTDYQPKDLIECYKIEKKKASL